MREKEGIVSIATKKICTANVSRMEINKRQLLKMGILRVQSKNTNIWFDLFDSHGWKWIGSFSQIDNRNLAIIHSRQSLCSKVLVVRGFSIVFPLSLPLRRDSGQGCTLFEKTQCWIVHHFKSISHCAITVVSCSSYKRRKANEWMWRMNTAKLLLKCLTTSITDDKLFSM